MQPPDLKGGGRKSRKWSCYDPERENKEDYDAIRMPSDAMAAVEAAGDMLESVDGGENTVWFSLANFILLMYNIM